MLHTCIHSCVKVLSPSLSLFRYLSLSLSQIESGGREDGCRMRSGHFRVKRMLPFRGWRGVEGRKTTLFAIVVELSDVRSELCPLTCAKIDLAHSKHPTLAIRLIEAEGDGINPRFMPGAPASRLPSMFAFAEQKMI